MAIQSLVLWAVISLAGYIIYHQSSEKSRRKLPPGPEPLPILGNINDFPPNGKPEYQHWLKHKDLFGGISSVTVMGMTLVIIHDKKTALDLLEQASSKTSGRLAAFTIRKAVDKYGKEIEVDVKPKPGILSYPTDFDFQIKPRSLEHVEIIKSFERRDPWEASDAKLLESIDKFEVMY